MPNSDFRSQAAIKALDEIHTYAEEWLASSHRPLPADPILMTIVATAAKALRYDEHDAIEVSSGAVIDGAPDQQFPATRPNSSGADRG